VSFAKHQQPNLRFPIAPAVGLLPALQFPHTRHNSGVMLLHRWSVFNNQVISTLKLHTNNSNQRLLQTKREISKMSICVIAPSQPSLQNKNFQGDVSASSFLQQNDFSGRTRR
jgi:hypothetical protein